MKVLALQRARVGDILMTTPALRALRARFPQAEVTFVCERPFGPILRSNKDVQTIIGVEPSAGLRHRAQLVASLRQRGFDLALDFDGSVWTSLLAAASRATRRIGFRSSRLALAYTDRVAARARETTYAATEKLLLLEPLGIEIRGLNPRPVLETGSRARDWARRTLETAAIGNEALLVTVAPGARAPEFCWPLERYARLLDLLAASHELAIVIFPWSGDKRLGAELARLTPVPLFQLDTTPSLSQMAALLDRADLHIGNESAAKHIASALGTATVTFYAPGKRRRWGSPGDPLDAGLEPDPGEERAGAAGAPVIARITPERAHAAIVALEAYLPRLSASRRREGAPGVARSHEPERGRLQEAGEPRVEAAGESRLQARRSPSPADGRTGPRAQGVG